MPDMVKKVVKLTKDPAGAPATDLSTLGSEHADLVKRSQKAGISLSKRGLAGIRAQAVLILDHSGSMEDDYESGVVQKLVERALGFALQIDADGKIPVIAFDSVCYPPVEVGVHNYVGVVERDIWKPRMGSTVMSAPLQMLKQMAEESDAPIFAIVVGDGSPNPDDRARTTKVVCELASYGVFLKFLTIRPVDYLKTLDDLETTRPGARLLDNVDAQPIPDPGGMSDLAFADAMTEEWDSWITAATTAGVLA